jgi:hypothetical protein
MKQQEDLIDSGLLMVCYVGTAIGVGVFSICLFVSQLVA